MSSTSTFHTKWGYLAPEPSFARMLRIVVVATTVGATAGAAVVLSLVEHPNAGSSNTVKAFVTAASSKTEPTVARHPQGLMLTQGLSAAPQVDSSRVGEVIRHEANPISAAPQLSPSASPLVKELSARAPDETTNDTGILAAPSSGQQAGQVEEQVPVHSAGKGKKHARIAIRRHEEHSARWGYTFKSSPFFRTW